MHAAHTFDGSQPYHSVPSIVDGSEARGSIPPGKPEKKLRLPP